MKGLFYLLPCIELWFYQRVPGNSIINGKQVQPYDTLDIYIAFLFWSKRFKINYR